MKKYLLFLMILVFTNTIANANESFNTYVKNLATCTPYRYTSDVHIARIDQEILGWEGDTCILRDILYHYKSFKESDILSQNEKQTKRQLVPKHASIYMLTQYQLSKYQKSLLNGIKNSKNSKNETSVTISSQNMRCIRAIKNYEYKNKKWVPVEENTCLMY